MFKLLLWVVVIIGLLFATRLINIKKSAPKRPATAQPPPASKGVEQMVRCAHCGIYLPRSEALMSNNHTWCSLEHSRLGAKKQ